MSKFVQFIIFILALLFIAYSVSNFGHKLENFETIKNSPYCKEWIFYGRFGPDGPFKVVFEKDFGINTECKFNYRGTPHIYPPMEGYAFKILKLKGKRNNESIVILRSREKQIDKILFSIKH